MSKLPGLPVAILVCLALQLGAGCTRTSDGSVVVARPTVVPGFLRPALAAQPVMPPPPPSPGVLQTTPAPPAVSRTRRSTPRIPMVAAGVRAPFEQGEAEGPLTCRNETTSTGRVRMVCD